MRICRYAAPTGVAYGLLEGDRVRGLAGDLFPPGRDVADPVPGREEWALEEVTLLPPVTPGKIVCVGLNYRTHAHELGLDLPLEPLLFLKPPSALIGQGMPIVRPAMSRRVDYEGEVVAVIGRRLRHATPEEAERGILGFTCGNDVTARDLQQRDLQWTRAKGFDTFAPLGPVIAVGLDHAALHLSTYVNGVRRQWDCTANLIFPVPDLVSYISRVMTLEPGDVVFTGTPAGIGPLEVGDEVEVEVACVGRLRNPVRDEMELFAREEG